MDNLKKDLGFKEVFSIASGAMISSGLFVLPALVFAKSGPFMVLCYFFAALLMVPAMFSKAELATAMPKSGGAYFFISRSMGPLLGTFAGLASWFSLALKSAFALMGIGIFLAPFVPFLQGALAIKIIALLFLGIFTLINVFSVKESGRLQVILLALLLFILGIYIIFNITHIEVARFSPEKDYHWKDIMKVLGMIFVSFGGLTKIAAVAEEVKNPGKNIPRGMMAAFILVTIIYILVVFVTIGITPPEQFSPDVPPISFGATYFMGGVGGWGFWLLSIAAMFAFVTTANAGIMASSRAPLAMSRDNLIPSFFSMISSRFKTPVIGVLTTSLFMFLAIVFLDIEGLVKVASAMMLILFALNNISVILMRESKMVSYKPDFKAPLYPYLNIIGTVIYFFLIIEMGSLALIITLVFLIFSLLWYFLYSKSRSGKDSALIQVVERVTSSEIKTSGLADELREILLERDSIVEDRFDRIIKATHIIDIPGEVDLNELFEIIATNFAVPRRLDKEDILSKLKAREEISSTVIHTGLAIPHVVIDGEKGFDILVLRSKEGIRFAREVPLVNIIFALAGTKDERNFHLQALMAIAQIVQNPDFQHKWMKTETPEELRNLILLTQRLRKSKV